MNTKLKRQVGLLGSVFLGLGSILGTGLFLSLAFATSLTGEYMIFALILAGFVACCNALNSAQLAANYPVSGGAYEYGYELLNPTLGFAAGWNFLLAKSASAAASALGFAYSLQTWLPIPIHMTAFFTVIIMTVLVAFGLKKSNLLNFIFVSLLVFPLLYMIGFISFKYTSVDVILNFKNSLSQTSFSLQKFLQASAILFVAYTGYGRIATLGEEIHEPRKNIPRSIIMTLVFTLLLYIGTSWISLISLHETDIIRSLTQNEIPILNIAKRLDQDWLTLILSIAVSVSFLSVLLNLILGLSRVLLAMSRRGDVSKSLQKLNKNQTSPVYAVLTIGFFIAGLALLFEFEKNWSMSAFSVLIYYGILNLSAWKLTKEKRLYPKFITLCGIISCFFLAFWVEWRTWLTGLGLIAIGFALRALLKILQKQKT